MKTNELLEAQKVDVEEIINNIREEVDAIKELEIYADNYPEIVETDKSERDELLAAIEALYDAANPLKGMK